MSMLLWNCRGERHPNFVRTVRELAGTHGPNIMVITETRARGEDVRHIIDRLPFDSWKDTATIGYKGGIWLLWKSDLLDVDDICATEQEIHATIKVKSNNFSWLISAIYASPRYNERLFLWENLKTVASHHDLPWLVLGDFNEVLNGEDKKGGRPVSLVRSGAFKDCLIFCHLADLGFSGPRFTWSNKRNVLDLIQERIDFVFANSAWCLAFPEARVSHLPKTRSDHYPILLSLKNKVPRVGLKPFRLQKMWFDYPEFLTLVRNSWSNGQESLAQSVLTLRKDMQEWNLNSFGNIFLKKKKILVLLSSIEKALANSPNQFLLNLQRTLLEEFNGILKAEDDIWILKSRLTTQDQHDLLKPISDLEIQKTFWSFKFFKAPGLDGLHPFFYHRCWNIVKDKICATIKQIFEVASMPEELNETLISLVPKHDITLLSKAKRKTTKSMHEVLMAFYGESGQTINLEKSKVLFSANTRQNYKRDITNLLGINETLDLGRYLGFPIHKRRVSKNDYAFIVNKVKAKALPVSISNLLDKVSRDFSWGKNGDKKRLHLLNWSEVTKKKNEGGLSLRKIRAQNQAQLAQLVLGFHHQKDALWVKMQKGKYL
ncbi:uncharacterized protein LOC111280610 [Durio zibethinus]|uniref:Uncharacterized protein LOC111280610 n=1 Tax=Durio zibethinus TaxID=66656 RepID=A0A6P5X7F1_DURZI|nr:uncharacterized protein LOC111280610 [Durio zibethinus]